MRLQTTLLGVMVFVVGSSSPALAQRFTFERSFDLTGPSSIDISTIQGRIEVTGGEPGRIVVVGIATVRVDWNVPDNAAELARKVADNPPIQQAGQTLRLTPPSDPTEQRAVTISYQVRVPRDTDVTATTESGETTVRGVSRAVTIRTQSGAIAVMQVGGATVLTTGSGAVSADDVAGPLSVTTSSSGVTARSLASDFRVRTQSGAVDAALAGDGAADVETGSSAIRLNGLRGEVTAVTRSGRITLQGEPLRNWILSNGSGGIDILTDAAASFAIDLDSGSGSVKVTGASVRGSVTKRKTVGNVSGGGSLVKAASRSGSIVVRVGEGRTRG
ncbi:MAG: DUF4097 family beta strand repeat-containing protein [Vicinamibacterales bacterium]